MREIKFRYWSKGIRFKDDSGWDSKMGWYVPQQYDYEGMDNPQDIIKDFQKRGIKVMQYTGLKDKNGVEIYEGDILKWEHPMFEEYKKLEVKDIRKSLMIKQDCNKGWIEVIGNIYENKDLLNE